MKHISKPRQEATEKIVLALLKDAYTKTKGEPVPVNDPDYSEAFGIIRGVLLVVYGNPTIHQPIRLASGPGEPTHSFAEDWLDELKTRAAAMVPQSKKQ